MSQNNEMPETDRSLLPPSASRPRTPLSASEMIDGLPQLTLRELLELRYAIDQSVPATALEHLDLVKEAILHYQRVKLLHDEVMGTNAQANYKAQVSNVVAATLEQLLRMQKEHYTYERLKNLEVTLIEVMEGQPLEVRKAFMEEYKRRLDDGQD